jgi:hypothetical protein
LARRRGLRRPGEGVGRRRRWLSKQARVGVLLEQVRRRRRFRLGRRLHYVRLRRRVEGPCFCFHPRHHRVLPLHVAVRALVSPGVGAEVVQGVVALRPEDALTASEVAAAAVALGRRPLILPHAGGRVAAVGQRAAARAGDAPVGAVGVQRVEAVVDDGGPLPGLQVAVARRPGESAVPCRRGCRRRSPRFQIPMQWVCPSPRPRRRVLIGACRSELGTEFG